MLSLQKFYYIWNFSTSRSFCWVNSLNFDPQKAHTLSEWTKKSPQQSLLYICNFILTYKYVVCFKANFVIIKNRNTNGVNCIGFNLINIIFILHTRCPIMCEKSIKIWQIKSTCTKFRQKRLCLETPCIHLNDQLIMNYRFL